MRLGASEYEIPFEPHDRLTSVGLLSAATPRGRSVAVARTRQGEAAAEESACGTARAR